MMYSEARKFVCNVCHGFQYVMGLITKAVDFIWSKSLDHKQFQHLSELGAECNDLVCCSEV
jgi:hypothetical protein